MAHLILAFVDVSALLSLELLLPRPIELDFGDLLDCLRFLVALGLRGNDPPFKKLVTWALSFAFKSAGLVSEVDTAGLDGSASFEDRIAF